MKTKRSESGFINLGSPRAPPLSLPKAVASLHRSLVSWEMTSDTFSWASSFQTHSHGPSPGAGLYSRLAFLPFCLRDSFNVSCNMALSVMNPLDWSRASQIFILLSFLKDVFAPLSSRLHCFSHTHKIYGVPHCCFFVDTVSFFPLIPLQTFSLSLVPNDMIFMFLVVIFLMFLMLRVRWVSNLWIYSFLQILNIFSHWFLQNISLLLQWLQLSVY